MRIGSFAFKPEPVPTLGAAALIALTLFLGRWQVGRAQEKEALQALFEARARETPVVLTGSVESAQPLLYRRVVAAGSFDAAGQIYVDNQVHDAMAGYFVITPLRLRDGSVVLVNRGWIARGARYPEPPGVEVPAGDVQVRGLAVEPPRRFLELSKETISGNVWQNLSIERYREVTHARALPVVILSEAPGPGLAAVHEKPDAGIAKHQEYALTWFSLAATTLVLWLALNVKRVA